MTDTLTDPSQTSSTPTFKALGLPDSLLKATDELGFEYCTEIQGLSLPVIAQGRDIAAQAQTGTGKTAAFLLGSFARLLSQEPVATKKDQPRMLVIAPTRELAMQIKKDADSLGRYAGLTSAVVYGGIDYEKQRKEVAAGVDVLIGTPGRLIDYFKQKIFDLSKLEIIVLDEADRMFDLGFIADIRFLLRRMPEPGDRLSMLYSATLSHRVMELAYEHMDNPEPIKTESTGVTAKGVKQSLYQPADDEKVPLLLGLLDLLKPPRSIVFVNTKRAAEKIEGYLLGNDVACGTLSGDVRQSKRQKILAEFTAGRLPVLIATDVAARGLHIDDVSHVFNYDLPQQAEDYVHRIGRTARAGSEGMAVSFACENYSFSLPEIQEYIGQSIPLEMITDELLVKPKPRVRVERDRPDAPGQGRKSGGGRSSGSNSRNQGGAKRGNPRRPDGAGKKTSASNSGDASSQSAAAGTEAQLNPAGSEALSSSSNNAATTVDANAAPKKKRRRRRRKPASEATANNDGGSDNTSNEPSSNTDSGS